MKLYEYTQKNGNTTYVGIILADKDNKICIDRVFSTNRVAYPYLSGIEMAVSFIKHNDYDQHEDLILYGPHLGVNDPITSMYIEKVVPYKRIIPNTKQLTEKDKEYLLLAKNRVECVVTPIELRMQKQNIKD